MKRPSPAHIQEVLRRERELAAQLFTPPTPEELAAIEHALALDRRQAEPQLGLPLQVAA